MNADRVEECDYANVDVDEGSGTTTPPLLRSHDIQPFPSGYQVCSPPLAVPRPPLPRVDGAMDEARWCIAAP